MFTVTVKPDGGEPFDVEVTTRDGLRWERARKGRSINQFSENPSIGDLYSLTFVAVQRDGRYGGDIRQFEEECDLDRHPDKKPDDEGEDGDDDGSEEGPTRPTR